MKRFFLLVALALILLFATCALWSNVKDPVPAKATPVVPGEQWTMTPADRRTPLP